LVRGEAQASALAKAVASVQDLIVAAHRDGLLHLPVIEHQDLLDAPSTEVDVEAVEGP
jgi:hypothetical protein